MGGCRVGRLPVFEAVDSGTVAQAACSIVEAARLQGRPDIMTIAMSKNRRAWSGGRVQNPNTQLRRVVTSDAFHTLVAVARLRYVQLGRGVASISGLMIGSRVSKVCCSLVIAASETECGKRAAHGFQPHIPWEDTG